MKLTEQFFTAEDVRGITAEVYRNPTTDEIEQHIPDGARGFIDLKGNLYLEGYDEKRSYSSINHQGVLSMVYHTTPDIFPYSYIEEYNLPLPQVYAATIQRFGTSNEIYVGESEHNSEAITGEFFRRCSQKNPQWKFINKSIATVDPGWSYTRKGGLIGLKDFGENYLVFDPVRARHHYKENSALRDQLRVMGVFNYINEDAAKVTKLTFEDTTDAGKTAKLNTIHSQYPFYIRPTEDYTLNNRVVKVNPEDEVYFQNGHIIVKRDGEVFQDLPAEKIEGIYWVDKSGLNERKINTYKTLMALCERHEYGDYKNILEIAEPMKAALIDYNEGLYNRLVKRVVLPKKLINEEIHYTDVGVITAFLKDNIPPMTDTGGIGKEIKGSLVYAVSIATGTILRMYGYNALALAYKSKGKDFIYLLTKAKPSSKEHIELIDLIGTKASEFGIDSFGIFDIDAVAKMELDTLQQQLSSGPVPEGSKLAKDLKPGDVVIDDAGDELVVYHVEYNEHGYFQGSKQYRVTYEDFAPPQFFTDTDYVTIGKKDMANPFEGDPMFKEAVTEDPLADFIYKFIYHPMAAKSYSGYFSVWLGVQGNAIVTSANRPIAYYYETKPSVVYIVDDSVANDIYKELKFHTTKLEVISDEQMEKMVYNNAYVPPESAGSIGDPMDKPEDEFKGDPFEGDEMFQEAGGEWTEKKISYDRDVFEAFINKDMDVTQIYGPNFGLYHSIGMSDSHDGYHLRFLYGGHTFAFVPENKTLLYIKAGETNSGSIASAEIAAAVEIKKLAMKKGYSILNELPPNKHDEPELDIGDPFAGDEMFKEAKANYKGYHQATDEELLIHFINQDFDLYESEQYELDVINYGSRITHKYPDSMNMVAMFVENDGLWYVSEFAPVALQESLEKLYNYDHVHFLDSKGQIEKDGVLIKANQKNYVGKPPRPEEEMGNPFEGDPMFKEHFGS